MTDQRFFHRAGPFALADIARHVGGTLSDETAATYSITDIAPLESAQEGDISVFTGTPYQDAFRQTRAGAVVTARALAGKAPAGLRMIFVAQPRLAYAQIGLLLYPVETVEPGIDPRAQVADSAKLGNGVRIESGAVIGARAEIGARCHIGHNSVIGPGVILGDDCAIDANCSITHAIIGASVRIASGVTIGSEGFGFVPGPKGLTRMRQLGRTIIEDRVEIGANCAIDRGATGDTVIGAGSVLDNLVHIGHNVRLGKNCILAGQVGIAGSTVLGDWVVMGGQVAIADHLTIGSGVRIAGKSGVTRDLADGVTVAGFPAIPVRQWHRQTVSLARLTKPEGN
jgi:UDP-3-O-[3-hydroxymyristoyl] glucosamine N-acyltransferase